MTTVLVTGGGGYIGSHLTRILLEKGYNVRVLDKLAFGEDSLKPLYGEKNLTLYRGDIRHIEDVIAATKGVDAVLDLAAIVGDPACALDEDVTTGLNLEATKVLLEISKRYNVKRFVFASTCSVYGASDNTVLTEQSPLAPVSLYATTKIDSERELFKDPGELCTTALRIATVFGSSPRMRFDLVANIMTAKAVTEKKIMVRGGDLWRPMVHCKDAARAFAHMLELDIGRVGGQIFNVGANDQNYRIIQIAETVQECAPGSVIDRNDNIEDRRNYRVDFTKIAGTGYKTTLSLKEGILEVKRLLDSGEIADYKDDKYYNVKYRFK